MFNDSIFTSSYLAVKRKALEDKNVPVKSKNDTKKGKGKGKLVLLHDNEEEVLAKSNRVELPSIRLRTTPKQLAYVMSSLSTKQKACLMDIGFGSILGFNIDSLPGRLVYYVVDNFDTKEMVIKTSKGNIKADNEGVFDVFGIPNGGIDIDTLEYRSGSPFVEQWKSQFPNKKHIRVPHIAEKMLSSVETDRFFQMNFLMLFANTMAHSEMNGKVCETVLNRVCDDIKIEDVDWCGFVIKCLKYSKTHWNRNDPQCYYHGPATFLALLYLDRTKFDKVPVPRQRPVFKNWKVAMVLREKKEAELGSFGMLELAEEFVAEEEQQAGEEAELDGVEGYYKLIEDKLEDVKRIKEFLLGTFKHGFSKYPNDDVLRGYYNSMKDVFVLGSDETFEQAVEEEQGEEEGDAKDEEGRAVDEAVREEHDVAEAVDVQVDDDGGEKEVLENVNEEEGQKAGDEEVDDEEKDNFTQWLAENVNQVTEICDIVSILHDPMISLSHPPSPSSNDLTAPNFHLLSQDDDADKHSNSSNKTPVLQGGLKTRKLTPPPPKRATKPSLVCRSPFVDRLTNLRWDLERSETCMALELFSAKGDPWSVI